MYRNNNKVFAPFQFKSSGSQELISETPGESGDVPVMRRKKWPLVLLLLLILAILVCTLPWVSRIVGTMTGAEVDPDGAVIAEGEFVLEGKFYDYLLRDDQFKLLDIQVPNRETGKPSAYTAPAQKLHSGLVFTHVYLELPEYDSDHNWYHGHLIWSEDRSWFVLEITERIFVGSADENPDYAGILELCQPYLMLDPQ